MNHAMPFALRSSLPLLVALSFARPALAQETDRPGWVREGQTDIALPDTSAYGEEQRRILALERRRSALIARHDTTALAQLYAPDLRAVTGGGSVVTRAQLFGVFAQDDPAARFEIDELRLRPVGARDGRVAAIVVTGRLRMLRDGREVVASRYLHVWERRAGAWSIVDAQGTAIRGP